MFLCQNLSVVETNWKNFKKKHCCRFHYFQNSVLDSHNQTDGQCGLLVYWSKCQTHGTAGVTIVTVSVGWWYSRVYVRLLVLVVLPY